MEFGSVPVRLWGHRSGNRKMCVCVWGLPCPTVAPACLAFNSALEHSARPKNETFVARLSVETERSKTPPSAGLYQSPLPTHER